MTSNTAGVNVHSFTDIGGAVDLSPYVADVEIFDAIPQLQELKALARNFATIGYYLFAAKVWLPLTPLRSAGRGSPDRCRAA
jgi:hypothetical protein